MTFSDEFKQYALRSVQLDQYYAAVRIFARQFDRLKEAYASVPRGDDWPQDLSNWSEPARTSFVMTSGILNYMGTTGIFSDAPHKEINTLTGDMLEIGFDSCFCFQWTLFEDFVRRRMLWLVDQSSLPEPVGKELRKLERRTRPFFAYINSGQVFGGTPFSTVLPGTGWQPTFEEFGFADLEAIIELRNQLTHAPPTHPIDRNDRLYEKSMWVLRKYAENLECAVTGFATNVAVAPH